VTKSSRSVDASGSNAMRITSARLRRDITNEELVFNYLNNRDRG